MSQIFGPVQPESSRQKGLPRVHDGEHALGPISREFDCQMRESMKSALKSARYVKALNEDAMLRVAEEEGAR